MTYEPSSVHVGTNNADKEGTTPIVEKYRNLLKKTKQAIVRQIILSGILPVFGNRIQGHRNSKRMAVNWMVKWLCKEEEVGYVDLWDCFCRERRNVRERWPACSWKGVFRFCRGIWAAVFTFNPYLLISINELLISIINLLISVNMDTLSIFIDINNSFNDINNSFIDINDSFIDINDSFIDINDSLLISMIHLLISMIHLLI